MGSHGDHGASKGTYVSFLEQCMSDVFAVANGCE